MADTTNLALKKPSTGDAGSSWTSDLNTNADTLDVAVGLQHDTAGKHKDGASLIMGTGTGEAKLSGMVSVNTTAVGTDADTVEKDLMTYSLPADSLSSNGKGIKVRAWGTTGANADNKTIKVYFGSATYSTGVASLNNNKWLVELLVYRTGASGQDWVASMLMDGNTTDVQLGTLTEDETAAITIKVTGQNAVATADDVKCEGMTVEFTG